MNTEMTLFPDTEVEYDQDKRELTLTSNGNTLKLHCHPEVLQSILNKLNLNE